MNNDFRIASGRPRIEGRGNGEGFIWILAVKAYEVLWENKQMSGLIRTSFGLKLRNVSWGDVVDSVAELVSSWKHRFVICLNWD